MAPVSATGGSGRVTSGTKAACRTHPIIGASGLVRAPTRGIIGEVTVDLIQPIRVHIGPIRMAASEAIGALRDIDGRGAEVAWASMERSRVGWPFEAGVRLNRCTGTPST